MLRGNLFFIILNKMFQTDWCIIHYQREKYFRLLYILTQLSFPSLPIGIALIINKQTIEQ